MSDSDSEYKRFIGWTLVIKGQKEKLQITDIWEEALGHGDFAPVIQTRPIKINLPFGFFSESVTMDDGTCLGDGIALVPPNPPPFIPWWRV